MKSSIENKRFRRTGRWWMLVLGLLILFLLPFLLFESYFSSFFSASGSYDWLSTYGNWAWLAGFIMLLLDVFLPLPGTLIIAALGYMYGPLAGGLLSASALFLAASLAYALAAVLGTGFTKRFVGPEDFERGKKMMASRGAYIVALTRWLPLLAETGACIAGLTRMPLSKFFLAVVCGVIPLGFLFAWFGYVGRQDPVLAIALNVLAPALLWTMASGLLKRKAPKTA